jgi:molybdenum cofactor cytidylyltransferase
MLRENGTLRERMIGQFLDNMCPVEEGFSELGIPALRRAMAGDSEWVAIDELGFLESENWVFQETVKEVFDTKRVIAVLRKQDLPFLNELKQREDVFLVDLDERKARVGCVIMASGISQRFGKNKLLQTVDGKTLLERILNITDGELFAGRVVVTRSEEVAEICKKKNVPVILHTYPNRNDTVRLGTEFFKEMDGWVFCPCDQPLLKKESLENLLNAPYVHEDLIVRLHWKETMGTPIFFGKRYFEDLCRLPEKKGGSYIVKQHLEKVHLISVQDERELWDLDTQEDLKLFGE